MDKLIDLDSAQVRTVLPLLLSDKTTHHNIIWATDTYESLGAYYAADNEMTPALVTSMGAFALQPRTAKTADDQQARTKKHAEVFTPAWICNKMNNHCDAVWFDREDVFNREEGDRWTVLAEPIAFPEQKPWQQYVDARLLEITCGEAPFLASRYDASTGDMIPWKQRIGLLDRKLRIVNENTTDEADWYKWVLRAFQSVYGYEFQGDSLLIARINLLITFTEAMQARWQREATRTELRKVANIITWNLWQMDGLKGTVPFGALAESHEQVSMWGLMGEAVEEVKYTPCCRFMDWRGDGSIQYNGHMTRKGTEMKFDFVIGNPPYQEDRQGESNTALPVYHKLMQAAYPCCKAAEFITPARFLFNAGRTPKEWNNEMLSDTHLTVLHYESDGNRIFSNTDIKGGVAITYRDITKDFGAIGTFTAYPELNMILHRVTAHKKDSKSLATICFVASKFYGEKLFSDYPEYSGHERRMSSNVLLFNCFHDVAQSADDIMIYGVVQGKRTGKYIHEKYVDVSERSLTQYKIVMPKADGNGKFGDTLTNPEILKPNSGFTHTFLGLGGFDTKGEAEAALKYIKTKFARALLSVLKVTQDVNADKWRYVPLQDFTPSSDIDWSVSVADIDKQLYRKYSLTEEEITFIESKVKEMA